MFINIIIYYTQVITKLFCIGPPPAPQILADKITVTSPSPSKVILPVNAPGTIKSQEYAVNIPTLATPVVNGSPITPGSSPKKKSGVVQ